MKEELDLKTIKERSLEILKFIDKTCKELNLRYYLAAGTLLGAVRHRGFIPWDDDIDIMMPRDDYEKLIHSFPKNDNFAFLNVHNTNNIYCPYGKIIDKCTIKIEPLRAKYLTVGVDVDVFPLDNYPNDYEEAALWCDEIKKIQRKKDSLLEPYGRGRNFVRTIMRNLIVFYNHIIDELGIVSVKRYVVQLDILSKRYNSVATDYCGIAAIAAYGVNKRNRKEVFADSVDVEFEGYTFPAPSGYDEYLRDYYGDYMQLPPLEKRQTHHVYKAYWK